MDTIIAPFLVRTQDYLRAADREQLRKIRSKWDFLRHYNDCECIEQNIMEPAHLVLHAIFSETTKKTEVLHDIKGDMKWQMTNFVGAPSKKRRIMKNPIVATIRSYLPQSNYEQLKLLYANACHIFKQQGWELDMSKLPDLDESDHLHDVYGLGAHMILGVLFGDMDTSIVVKHLDQIISEG